MYCTTEGLRGIAEATVPAMSSSVEGVPAEFAGYLVQVLRLGVRDCDLQMSLAGGACDGGWAGFELRDLVPHATVCAAWHTELCRPDWASGLINPAPEWPKAQGWVLDDDGSRYRREFPKLHDPASVRRLVQEVMLAAQSVFGLVPPWLWTLEINSPVRHQAGTHPDMFDLRKLGNGGLTPPPRPTVYPGCTESGYIVHTLGECDLHLPCDGRLGCGTANRVSEPCDGCATTHAFIQGR